MSQAHKIIAVYGNSGSYKTSTSVSLAKAIMKKDKNANVVVVGLDASEPLIPILFPHNKDINSIGKLLSSEKLDQETILNSVIINDKISILGYNSGENKNSYAFPTESRTDDFLMQMRHLYNYTIIDCTSDVVANKLTAKTLINADNVIYLLSCDVKGLTFFNSQEPILLSEQYGYRHYWRYLTINGRFIPDIETMQNAIPQIRGVIPYSEKLPVQWNNGEGLKPLSDSGYNNVVDEIAAAIMEE